MTTLFFNESIDFENVSKFIYNMDEKIKDNEKDFIIYFSSSGGDPVYGDVLINYINELSIRLVKIRIKVYAAWQTSSSAFNVFFKIKCDREILNNTWAEIHLSTRDINVRELKKESSCDNFMLKELNDLHKKDLDFFKSLGISDEKINQIKKGEDVFLNKTELLEILNNQQNKI